MCSYYWNLFCLFVFLQGSTNTLTLRVGGCHPGYVLDTGMMKCVCDTSNSDILRCDDNKRYIYLRVHWMVIFHQLTHCLISNIISGLFTFFPRTLSSWSVTPWSFDLTKLPYVDEQTVCRLGLTIASINQSFNSWSDSSGWKEKKWCFIYT